MESQRIGANRAESGHQIIMDPFVGPSSGGIVGFTAPATGWPHEG